jgi:hypothetical protein
MTQQVKNPGLLYLSNDRKTVIGGTLLMRIPPAEMHSHPLQGVGIGRSKRHNQERWYNETSQHRLEQGGVRAVYWQEQKLTKIRTGTTGTEQHAYCWR